MVRNADKEDRLGDRRETLQYDKLYNRIQLQPFWAWVGLIACSVLILTNGWYYIFAAARGTMRVKYVVAGLIASYFGVSYSIHAYWTELESMIDFVCSLFFFLDYLGCIFGNTRGKKTQMSGMHGHM
jgi:hypothetical protein